MPTLPRFRTTTSPSRPTRRTSIDADLPQSSRSAASTSAAMPVALPSPPPPAMAQLSPPPLCALSVSRPRTPSLSHVSPILTSVSADSLPSLLADGDQDLSGSSASMTVDPSDLSLSTLKPLLHPHPPPLPDQLYVPSAEASGAPAAPGQPHDRLSVPVLHEEEKDDALDTPDDVDLDEPLIDWQSLKNWRTYCKWSHWPKYAIVFFLAATTIPVAIEHKQLVDWLRPFIAVLGPLPAGWLIPVVILFVISFPPLFGHEIIAVLVGLVWGFGLGFIIVAGGSVLGEIGNFYAFRFLLSAKGHRAEKTNLRYACLARIIREGGFLIAVVARLSAIPGHLTTAIFSTCGMKFLTFTFAAILSMPKQMATVYLGVVLLQSADGRMSPRNQALSAVIILITILVTVFAALWIYWKMSLAYPIIVAERRLAREQRAHARLRRAGASASAVSLPALVYDGAATPPMEEEKDLSTLSLTLPTLAISRVDDVDSSASSSSGSPPQPAVAETTVEKSDVEISPVPRGGLMALVRRLGAPSGSSAATTASTSQEMSEKQRRPHFGRAISDLVLPRRTEQADPEKGSS